MSPEIDSSLSSSSALTYALLSLSPSPSDCLIIPQWPDSHLTSRQAPSFCTLDNQHPVSMLSISSTHRVDRDTHTRTHSHTWLHLSSVNQRQLFTDVMVAAYCVMYVSRSQDKHPSSWNGWLTNDAKEKSVYPIIRIFVNTYTHTHGLKWLLFV